jgi:hypothetical protein
MAGGIARQRLEEGLFLLALVCVPRLLLRCMMCMRAACVYALSGSLSLRQCTHPPQMWTI